MACKIGLRAAVLCLTGPSRNKTSDRHTFQVPSACCIGASATPSLSAQHNTGLPQAPFPPRALGSPTGAPLRPLALKDSTLLSSKLGGGGGEDSFLLSNKVIENDGHSCAALCHHGPLPTFSPCGPQWPLFLCLFLSTSGLFL